MIRDLFLIGAAALLLPSTSAAQQIDAASIAAQRAAIARIDIIDGMWRGSAVQKTPAGEHRMTQTERVGSLLDGSIKLIEGRGYGPDGATVFNALAVIAWDPVTKAYHMRTHAQGRSADPKFAMTDAGFVWEFPAGGATIRYTATIGGGKWREIGEYLMPGRPPMQFFEMNLTRIGDSPWPAGGTVPAK
jgi:hypothetical protein